MKHTKGKWIVTEDGEANFSGIADKYNWLFRIQQNGELTEQVQRANTKLISKAPDMLELLEEIDNEITIVLSSESGKSGEIAHKIKSLLEELK